MAVDADGPLNEKQKKLCPWYATDECDPCAKGTHACPWGPSARQQCAICLDDHPAVYCPTINRGAGGGKSKGKDKKARKGGKKGKDKDNGKGAAGGGGRVRRGGKRQQGWDNSNYNWGGGSGSDGKGYWGK